MKYNTIGLDSQKAHLTAKKLNVLLASYHQLYMNLRGFHWNIRGARFFELHLKFEELYNDINLKIDDLAERILALNHIPAHSFAEITKLSTVPGREQISEARQILSALIDDYKSLLLTARQSLKLAQDGSDEGTITLLTENIMQHEKTSWMLNAAQP